LAQGELFKRIIVSVDGINLLLRTIEDSLVFREYARRTESMVLRLTRNYDGGRLLGSGYFDGLRELCIVYGMIPISALSESLQTYGRKMN
jgi:hypothetical protein